MSNEKRWVYFEEKEVEGLEADFVAMLDMARKYAGVPFVITSGRRSPSDNATVGGVQDSAHLRGRAVDLCVGDSASRFKIVKGSLAAGFRRIGIYTNQEGKPTHVHIDNDMDLPQEVMWGGISH